MSDLQLEEAPAQTPRRTGFDFRIYTAGVEIVSAPQDDQPIVRAVGSSNTLDLQGDVMELPALQSLTQTPAGLLCFLNHHYDAPEDMAGQLTKSPWLQFSNKIADLYLDIRLFTRRNPRVVNLYQHIQDGVQMGTSVGCMVKDYAIEDDDVRLHILDAESFEWSFTPLPANRRSWVEQAAKGLFERTLDVRLAPIVKQLWPGYYREVVNQVTDKDQREYLTKVAARTASTKRLFWYPERRAFSLKSAIAGDNDSDLIARDAVEALLVESVASLPPTHDPEQAGRHEVTLSSATLQAPALPPITVNVTVNTAEPTTQKAASEDDKKAQEARSKKYHIGIKEGGNVTKPSEYADVSTDLFADPVNFRYPLDSKARADNAASRWGDADNRSQYNGAEQKTIGDRIEARQRDFGEEPEDTEKMIIPALAKALTIAADGSHDAPEADMEHSHSHSAMGSQGGDGSHEHTHPHTAGSASHDHPDAHNADKSAAPAKTAASCGCCAACTSPGCGCCDQCQPDKAASVTVPGEETVTTPTPAVAKSNDFLTNWQSAQAAEGIYEDWYQMTNTLQSTLRSILADDTIDDKSTAALASLTQFCSVVLAWVTRADTAGIYSDDDADMLCYGIDSLTQKMFALRKAGAEFSATNKAKLQKAHDTNHTQHDQLMDTCPDLVCPGNTPSDGTADSDGSLSVSDAQQQANIESGQNLSMAALPDLTKGLEALNTAFKAFDLEALEAHLLATKGEALSVQSATEEAKTRLTTILNSVKVAEAAAAELHREVAQLSAVRILPPTRLVTRHLAEDPGAATREEMIAAGKSLPVADSSGATVLAQTSVEEVEGRGPCRIWPAGIGGMVQSKGGQRPELTQKQVARMTTMEITLYELGAEIRVPELQNFE